MLRSFSLALVLSAAVALPARAADVSTSLRGSPASMVRQNAVAKENDYSFLRTPAQVEHFVEAGYLVPVTEDANHGLAHVSFPYARPEVRTFIERLSAQYREGCGEKLIVTSLTRPLSMQPRNAHDLSVHPAGMAVDLRVSSSRKCRSWLEETLLSLERMGMLDVTREHHPPHYHVAVFTDRYGPYVERRVQDSLAVVAAAERAEAERKADAMDLLLPDAGKTAATGFAATADDAPERDSRDRPLLAGLVLIAGTITLIEQWRRAQRG